MLPEFRAGELDLAASSAVWVSTQPRAKQIESSLHKSLHPYAAKTDHQGDGHSEWFEAVVHPLAIRMLSQMPVDKRTDRPARVLPLTMPPPPADGVSIETGPQDAWWALEDLWSRLAMLIPMTVETEGDVHRVILHRFKQESEGPVGALRMDVMKDDTYQCRSKGKLLSFVSRIEYRGEDLVCTLRSLKTFERWAEGPDLVWQVKWFLPRLQRQAGVRFPPWRRK